MSLPAVEAPACRMTASSFLTTGSGQLLRFCPWAILCASRTRTTAARHAFPLTLRGAGQPRSGTSCRRAAFGRGRNGCVAVALAWLAGRGLDAVLRCGGAHASLPRQFLQRGTRRCFRGGAGHAAAESHAEPYGINGGDELCLRSAVVAHAELQLAVSACDRNYACPLAWLASRSPIKASAVAKVAERPKTRHLPTGPKADLKAISRLSTHLMRCTTGNELP